MKGGKTPNSGHGFSQKGYNPHLGEITLEGYVRNNASPMLVQRRVYN